jgi:nitroreductase
MTPPITPESTAAVDAAITSRRSIRAFLPTPVPRETVEQILRVAARAPSGTNTQPWQVHVLTGEAQGALSRDIRAAYDDPAERARTPRSTPTTPPSGVSPYIDRRRKVGWDLYGLLGIGKADKARMHEQHGRNYDFFDAPVGLIFTIDRVMQQGSWLDYGMFLQNVMVAARARGLDTCPQAAFTQFHRIIAAAPGLPRDADGGLRHVAGPCRPGGGGEHAGHRARAGGRLHALPDVGQRFVQGTKAGQTARQPGVRDRLAVPPAHALRDGDDREALAQQAGAGHRGLAQAGDGAGQRLAQPGQTGVAEGCDDHGVEPGVVLGRELCRRIGADQRLEAGFDVGHAEGRRQHLDLGVRRGRAQGLGADEIRDAVGDVRVDQQQLHGVQVRRAGRSVGRPQCRKRPCPRRGWKLRPSQTTSPPHSVSPGQARSVMPA